MTRYVKVSYQVFSTSLLAISLLETLLYEIVYLPTSLPPSLDQNRQPRQGGKLEYTA